MPKRGARASLDKAPAPSPAKKACVAALSADELIRRAAREPTRATFDYRPLSFWREAQALPAVKVVGSGLRKCLQAVKTLIKKKGGVYFCDPVDPIELGIPDYYDVVNKPMDLGTIQTWIEAGHYDRAVGPVPAHKQCAEDVELVFTNAMAYNPAGSEVYTFASKLLDEWKQMFAKVEEEVQAAEAAEAAAAAKKALKSKSGAAHSGTGDGGDDKEGRGRASRSSMGGGGDGGASKTGGQVHGQWGCFCGVRSPGDGTDGDGDVVGLGGQLLPQRRMQHFLIVDKDGKPANADEGHMLVGTLQRPGFEEKDQKVSESEATYVSVPLRECFFEYYCDRSMTSSTLWVRGDVAWYRLAKPARCYVEAFDYSEKRLRIGNLLKTQLFKTPKVNFERMFQVLCGKAIAFLAPVSVKQRLREKMTRTILLSEAAYLAACIDDVAEVLHRGESRIAQTRRLEFGDKLIRPLQFAAATVEGEKRWNRLCAAHGVTSADVGGDADTSLDVDMEDAAGRDSGGGRTIDAQGAKEDGPLGLLGSLPGTEALQVCCALEGACLGATFAEARTRREDLRVDSCNEGEIRAVLDSVIEKIAKLHALPRGTVLCEDKSKDVVDYCRTVVDFLDCCGAGLFLASEKPRDLLPPEPRKLLQGVAAHVPSDAVVRLHLKLLSLLDGTVRLDSKAIPPIDMLTWPEKLRAAMEEDLLLRAQNMILERKENGEVLKIELDHLMEEDDATNTSPGGVAAGAAGDLEGEGAMEESESRRTARAYLRYYAEYFAEELEVVEHLKKECYSTMPEVLRWRALDWLCSSVSEKEEGAVRTELERRMQAGRVLEKLQDQMRPQQMQLLSPELRVVAVALNAILVEDAKSYGWFSAPVDAEKLGLTDYHEVVKTPMDLGTVLGNMMKVPSAYEGPHSAIRDVRQVWINARAYNGRNSPVTKAAEHLEALFDSALIAAREGSAGEVGALETVVATVATPADASRRAEQRERAAAVRSEPVGKDRLGRSYYWDGGSLIVENSTGLVDLELLCQYDTSEHLTQLLDFLDDAVHEDRQLKAWLLVHRAAFEPDALPREDAVGAWTVSDKAEQPPSETSAADFADQLAALLRQQGQQLHDTILALPMPLLVRKSLHKLHILCQNPAEEASVASGTPAPAGAHKESRAALKDTLLELEAAMVDSDVLSPAWTEAGGAGVEWRRATVAALTPSALGLQIFRLREGGLEHLSPYTSREMSRSQWMKASKNARLMCPTPLQEVTYLGRGHQEHLRRYGKHPWEDGMRSAVKGGAGGEMCQVENVRYFGGDQGSFSRNGRAPDLVPFAVVCLRSLQIAAAPGEGVAAAVPGGGVGPVGGAGGRAASPSMPEGSSNEVEGQLFHVTLHAGHSLAEMLIDSAVYVKSLEQWKKGEEVKMWFAHVDGVGGSFYHGTVIGQSLGENGDAWDSVTVRWNDDEEMQVCPWELKRRTDSDKDLSSTTIDSTVRSRVPFVGVK